MPTKLNNDKPQAKPNQVEPSDELKASLSDEQVATLTAWGFFDVDEDEIAEEKRWKAEERRRRREAREAAAVIPTTRPVESPELRLKRLEAEIEADKKKMRELEGKELAAVMKVVTQKRAEYDELLKRWQREEAVKQPAMREFLRSSFGDEAAFERLWVTKLRDEAMLDEMRNGAFHGIPRHDVFNAF